MSGGGKSEIATTALQPIAWLGREQLAETPPVALSCGGGYRLWPSAVMLVQKVVADGMAELPPPHAQQAFNAVSPSVPGMSPCLEHFLGLAEKKLQPRSPLLPPIQPSGVSRQIGAAISVQYPQFSAAQVSFSNMHHSPALSSFGLQQ